MLVSNAIRNAPKNKQAMTMANRHDERYWGEWFTTESLLSVLSIFWLVSAAPIALQNSMIEWFSDSNSDIAKKQTNSSSLNKGRLGIQKTL
jgi:hypothetical protein